MKLIEIDLTDFRQFYGKQIPIKLAADNKNITIIFGENGEGKTGIFRALMFALFGTRYLSQDNEKDDIHLVNLLKLKENEGNPVTANVTVVFGQGLKVWRISRDIMGYQAGKKVIEKMGNIKLNEIDENGNLSPNTIEDENVVSGIINKIIDEKIKDFFLFDGEKIETLAKTNSDVKKEIKAAIIKLLQIDKIDLAKDILEKMYRKEQRRITEKSSNIDVQQAQKSKSYIEEELKNIQELMETYKENQRLCQKEIEETDRKLSETKPIRELQNKIEEKKKEKDAKCELLYAHKRALKESYFNEGHFLVMKDVYGNTKLYLNQLLTEQNDLVSIEVIEKILREGKCICGTDINSSKEVLEKIQLLKTQYSRSKLTPFIGQVNGVIYDFEKRNDEVVDNLREKLSKIREVKDEVDDIDQQISELLKEKKERSRDEKNLSELENKLDDKKIELARIRSEINRLNDKTDQLESDLKEAIRKLDEIISADTTLRKDRKRLDYIARLSDEFNKLFIEYSDEMRKELMKTTTEIFKTLINKKDRELIERVEINEKYELELHNWNGTKITQDISQGQRQIVALSFITALAKVAADGRDNIDFPLFMDTPFGRMSGTNRDNLIKNIPNLASQWILLLTDTEFSQSEEIMVKSTNKLGRWYRLEQKKVYHTDIVEVNLNDTMATRR
ncbi:AAA family ATPase [Clostridium sp. DL1XJH146]